MQWKKTFLLQVFRSHKWYKDWVSKLLYIFNMKIRLKSYHHNYNFNLYKYFHSWPKRWPFSQFFLDSVPLIFRSWTMLTGVDKNGENAQQSTQMEKLKWKTTWSLMSRFPKHTRITKIRGAVSLRDAVSQSGVDWRFWLSSEKVRSIRYTLLMIQYGTEHARCQASHLSNSWSYNIIPGHNHIYITCKTLKFEIILKVGKKKLQKNCTQERRMIIIYPGIDNNHIPNYLNEPSAIDTMAAKPKWYKLSVGWPHPDIGFVRRNHDFKTHVTESLQFSNLI